MIFGCVSTQRSVWVSYLKCHRKSNNIDIFMYFVMHSIFAEMTIRSSEHQRRFSHFTHGSLSHILSFGWNREAVTKEVCLSFHRLGNYLHFIEIITMHFQCACVRTKQYTSKPNPSTSQCLVYYIDILISNVFTPIIVT